MFRSLCLAAALAAGASHAQAGLVAKQLAGPPGDFAAMRAPDPIEAAVLSKSALLPVTLAADATGGLSWEGTVAADNGRLRFLVFSSGEQPWHVEVRAAGQAKRAPAKARESRRVAFGIEQARHPADDYLFEGVERGAAEVKLSAGAGSRSQGYLLVEGDPALELAAYQTHREQLAGGRVGFNATLMTSAAKAGGTARILTAALRVTKPDGSVFTLPMFDDGKHGDALAGDGVYGAAFPTLTAGRYLAQVVASGDDADGQVWTRTTEHVVPVVATSLKLAGGATATRVSESRLSLDIAVERVGADAGRHYRAYGELWGTGSDGRPVPVAWVGGMVAPVTAEVGFAERFDLGTLAAQRDALATPELRERTTETATRTATFISLGFDERWITLANARAPFELRDLRIEDPDHFVPVATAARLPLTLPDRASHAAKFAAADIAIDELMTMGPRPPALRASLVRKGSGSQLLLVHGYCAGGAPWPTAHFTNASTFLDLNQNRTHDQFAQRIRDFGATWNSFGTVAHSQGGAASLHLYAYYWSGLDNATGDRLIQSVGTPYKGTNLAGVLAALGGIFGVGCGSNDNLTYSGAAAWLAGIPASARAKVNYYTTSFRKTNWWTNDYCNFAADLVLADPEDGTTEQVNGQLSGGVNRGHVTGQCHTSGMRDPAQYLDASRNAVMNTNAAR
ncbi:MAG: conditioned medium factor [Betaproteobacteria bacterium]|nr:conditioned medium factor [Betaproteobacteria bacterium]